MLKNELKPQRNKSLFEDRKNGMTYKKLTEKYGVSLERCRQIFLREERKLAKENNSKDFSITDFMAMLKDAKIKREQEIKEANRKVLARR